MESFRGPPSGGLDQVRGDPADGEVSCAAGAQRLASYVFWKESSETFNKPQTSRHVTVGTQPKFGVEGERLVARL